MYVDDYLSFKVSMNWVMMVVFHMISRLSVSMMMKGGWGNYEIIMLLCGI